MREKKKKKKERSTYAFSKDHYGKKRKSKFNQRTINLWSNRNKNNIIREFQDAQFVENSSLDKLK